VRRPDDGIGGEPPAPPRLAPAPPAPALDLGAIRAALPGLLLAAGIAALAVLVRALPPFASLSPLILAIVLGMAIGNLVGAPAWAKPGIAFAMRRALRLGIVLLGLQLTVGQVASIGASGVFILVSSVAATFLFAVRAGRAIGVDPKLAELVGAGTAICDASAVVAANSVTRARDEHVAYAVACVTLFGTASMLAYPALAGLIGLDSRGYGLWAGASIHEVAQVVAAAYQHGEAAGEAGTVAKLSRVLMLAPLVLALSYWTARRGRNTNAACETPPPPWFVFGFVGMVLVASTGLVPPSAQANTAIATQFLLAAALAAMGLETHFGRLAALGLRPFLLGAASTLFIALFSLTLVRLLAV
jgi:uncharacterized integral membrane protein (TIGR00698 family)